MKKLPCEIESYRSYRIVTFIPLDNLGGLLLIIKRHVNRKIPKSVDERPPFIPLRYGNYDQVWWHSAPGVEHFVPLEGSTPTKGKVGEEENVTSIRLEFGIRVKESDSIEEVEKSIKEFIEEAIIPAHPWDEPVVYFYQVKEIGKKVDQKVSADKINE